MGQTQSIDGEMHESLARNAVVISLHPIFRCNE